ncbi:MAG: beta-propeller fold lactonase family protein [Victivallaceae bacterium]|nr:beta-propeller fold lactonase family protein [Victivallaceae bacterium]
MRAGFLCVVAALFAAAGCATGGGAEKMTERGELLLAMADRENGGVARIDDGLTMNDFLLLPGVNYLIRSNGVVYGAVDDGRVGVAAIRDGKLLTIEYGEGRTSCHLAVSPGGNYLYLANYGDGSVDEFRLTGGLPEFVRNLKLGEGARAHFAGFAPDGELVIVDLGSDAVCFFDFDETSGCGALAGRVDFPEKSGPRHLVWLDGDTFAVACELNSTLVIVRGRKIVQTLATTFSGTENYPGALRLSPDGRWLVVTNRGDNTLGFFTCGGDGDWKLVSTVPCGGVWPRDCYFHDGRIYVANDRSHNIAEFEFSDGAAKLLASSAVRRLPMSFLELE